jgi:hypothetical protein
MREVNGRLVCENLAEVVDPRRTALLVVDVAEDPPEEVKSQDGQR